MICNHHTEIVHLGDLNHDCDDFFALKWFGPSLKFEWEKLQKNIRGVEKFKKKKLSKSKL